MKFLDFFSGIGGFRLGLEQAGHECVGHCEIDKFALKSYYAMHNPKKGEWCGRDITRVKSEELPKADIWTLGFPCQDISLAGKRKGLEGARSGLFYEIIRLIKGKKEEDKPKVLLIENVKNLLSVNGGWDFARILISLDEAGYDAEWSLLNSREYGGVPQNRERVYIVGHLRGRCTRKVFPIKRTNGKAINRLINGSQGKRVYSVNGSSPCLNSNGGGLGGKTGLYVVGNIRESGHRRGNIYDEQGISPTPMASDYKEPVKILVSPVLTPGRSIKRQNGPRIKKYNEPMFTITASEVHGIMIKEATKKGYKEAFEGDSVDLQYANLNTRRGRVGRKVAHTLDTQCNQGVVDGIRIRKLTPLECFRLQGFPDELFYKAREVNSDSQLYKQAGNSVTVSVVYNIAKKL